MPIIVTFHFTRVDTDNEFFWESPDPEVSSVCDAVNKLADECGIVHSFWKSEDNLTAVSNFISPTYDQYTDFLIVVRCAIPTAFDIRNKYFFDAQHTLTMEITDTDTNELIVALAII